jgi:hypothetical protein
MKQVTRQPEQIPLNAFTGEGVPAQSPIVFVKTAKTGSRAARLRRQLQRGVMINAQRLYLHQTSPQ